MHKRLIPAAVTAAALLLPLAAHAQGTQNYLGNAGTGFGGTLGNGSLTVSSTTSNVTFLFNPSGGFGGNEVVVYIDSKTGGVSNTSTFTDNGDAGREAIAGYNGQNPSRTLATFPTGFTADYAIEFENNVYTGLFDLSTPTNFGYISGNTPTNGGPYSIVVPDASLGLTPGSAFKFVGSLISTTAYRSNETLGTSVTTPETGSTPNAGFTGSTTFSTSYSYTTAGATATPEPSDIVSLLFGMGVLGGTFLVRKRGV